MKNNSSSSSGLGCFGVVQVVFLVLKFLGLINWSWVWVLSPLWMGILFWALVFVAILILASWK